jgi:predicted HD superfamily hydrolase involved in NAD metabolism
MAIDLAQHYQLDPELAQQAALMHDLAKYYPPQLLLEMARTHEVPLDPILEVHPHLLHAEVGAIVARTEFGIEDQEILNAIANHTLGQPGMSPLSCVIFLADTLEPTRGDTAELNTLRSLCFESLHLAVWKTCDYTLQYLMKTALVIHPRPVLTRNWALRTARRGVGSRE